MFAFPFLRARSVAVAAGFPSDPAVRSRKLKSGAVVLVNGTNCFTMSGVDQYQSVKVKATEDGAHSLVAEDASGKSQILAVFGSEAAAANGHGALVRASAGRSLAGRPWVLRTALVVGVAWFFLAALTSSLSNHVPIAQSSPGAQGSLTAGQYDQQIVQKFSQTESSTTNPSLEQLANGGYKFQPKIELPQMQAPALNCPPSKG